MSKKKNKVTYKQSTLSKMKDKTTQMTIALIAQ